MVSTLSLLVSLLSLGAAVAQCGTGTAKLTFEIMFDSNPGQTSIDLVNYAGNMLETITLPISSSEGNTLVEYVRCVNTNNLYKIAVKDSAGNGMSEQGYVSIAINDRVIASISDFNSEAVYYLVADGGDCGGTETRAVVNIRYDGLPAETTWSITNADTNGLVISQDTVGIASVRARNTAALANQFLHVDKCIPPGSYVFSITDPNGISSPGFYRFFNEYNLMAVGGSQSGTSSTAFTASDTPAPTPVPTKDICDDKQFEKFMDDEGVMQPCIWLLARPAKQDILCSSTNSFKNNSPNARDVCEETCGVCTDNCADNNNVNFVINGESGRTCEWVRVRIQFNNDFWRTLLCVPGNPAWDNCKETCEDCPEEEEVTTNSPGTTGTTGGPTPNPMLTDPCDDRTDIPIRINNTIGDVPCRWLETRPGEQQQYCAIGNPSNAYNICEETCGKCEDTCTDSDDTIMDNNDIERPCSWLADDPINRRPLYCDPNTEAWDKCKETCGNCV